MTLVIPARSTPGARLTKVIWQGVFGQPARIRVETFKEKTFTGKVTTIFPMGTEKDNVTTFEVRVSINNPGGGTES